MNGIILFKKLNNLACNFCLVWKRIKTWNGLRYVMLEEIFETDLGLQKLRINNVECSFTLEEVE